MVLFDSTSFGQVVINGKSHGDVLVINDDVIERDRPRLKERYGTSHVVGEFELEALLADGIEAVVIGTGQSGVLNVAENIQNRCVEQGVELIEAPTPEAVEIYNRLAREGRRANALVHSTC